jgi:hypothetical protein
MTTTKVGDTFRRTCEGGNGPVYEVTELTPTTAKLPGFGWEELRWLDDRDFWIPVVAVEQVPAARLAEREAIIRRLRDVAIGAIPHYYSGACHESFRGGVNTCAACAPIMEANALLGDEFTT